jgi:hypothetical protein
MPSRRQTCYRGRAGAIDFLQSFIATDCRHDGLTASMMCIARRSMGCTQRPQHLKCSKPGSAGALTFRAGLIPAV